MNELVKLLADCDAHGIRLLVAGDGGLTIDAPQDTLTPDLMGRLKGHKAALLTLLRPMPDVAPDPPAATRDAPAKLARAICRCGTTTSHDVPIHGGQSIRRDCGRCGRFIDFPIWYKNGT